MPANDSPTQVLPLEKSCHETKKADATKCPAAIDLVGSLVNQPTGYYGVLFS
jgi:hypothetical protein